MCATLKISILTPACGLKFQPLKLPFLKIMVKTDIDFFCFEIEQAPSELLLPSAKKSAQKG